MSVYKPINTFEVGDEVSQIFLVAHVEKRFTKTGKPYARVKLKDGGGEITTNLWDFDLDDNQELTTGVYVQMTIQVEEFRGWKQAKAKSLPMLLALPDDADATVYTNEECNDW